MLEIDDTEIIANIYTEAGKVLYAKVSLPGLGMHINSIIVRQSVRNPAELWIQAPAVPYKGKFIKPLEFERGSLLWDLIQDAVKRAVDEYRRENQKPP